MASEPVSTRSSLATCSRSYESKMRSNQLCVTTECHPFLPVAGRNRLTMRSVTSRSQPLQDQASTTPVVPSRCSYFASSFPLSLGSGFLELQYLSLPRCCTGAQREARRSHRPFPAFELTRTAQPHPHFQQSQSTQILASSDQDRQVTSFEAQITNWEYFVAR